MKELAQETFQYLWQQALLSLAIALVMGFFAWKTVGQTRKGAWPLYLLVGLAGSFIGQLTLRYFNLKEVLDQVPDMRILFDLVIAYVGSFVLAALINFFKPM
ncbi:MAG: hypothetical protein HY695_22110 [Deltaproteobacteria bacterium]|nr:hypothetical protein [Deltaproteobacteria bacterium]